MKYIFLTVLTFTSAQAAKGKMKYLLFYTESASVENDTSRLISFDSKVECEKSQKDGLVHNGKKIFGLESNKYPHFWSNCALAEVTVENVK
ncbi:hypothetical protein [Bdellovibrio sp. NC01]|uniref:hypothetical protein n=1 Tax=Bdellovibrio sp. NC01 TaxID=2220073 RepID=UPI001157E3FD|nr:hypothetical protein [Bdellovibrio sp. NC01]QDK37908.1 hypothetical protein DOE51_10095 [Bdellovibrio sp. NC01]